MNLKTPFVVLAAAGLLAFGGAGGAVAGALITSTQIKDETILSRDIRNGAITTADLATSSVTTGDIRDGQVTSADIATGGVTSSDVKDGSVTLADLSPEVIAKINAASGEIWNAHQPAAGSAVISEIAGPALTAGQTVTINAFSYDGDFSGCDFGYQVPKVMVWYDDGGGASRGVSLKIGVPHVVEKATNLYVRAECGMWEGGAPMPEYTATVNYTVS